MEELIFHYVFTRHVDRSRSESKIDLKFYGSPQIDPDWCDFHNKITPPPTSSTGGGGPRREGRAEEVGGGGAAVETRRSGGSRGSRCEGGRGVGSGGTILTILRMVKNFRSDRLACLVFTRRNLKISMFFKGGGNFFSLMFPWGGTFFI